MFEVNSLFQHCLDSFESVWIYFSLLVFENITEFLNLKVEELCKKYLSFIIFNPFTYLELFFILSLCPDVTPNPSILTKCSKDEAYAYYPVIVIIQVFWQNMCTKSWCHLIFWYCCHIIFWTPNKILNPGFKILWQQYIEYLMALLFYGPIFTKLRRVMHLVIDTYR